MKHVSFLVVVVAGGFLGTGSLTYGENPHEGRATAAKSTRDTQRASQDRSAVMPAAIEEFVRTFGDGTVTTISPGVLSDAQAVNTDRDAVLALLQPVKHTVNSGPVTLRAISDQQPDTTGLIAGTAIVLEDGTEIQVGKPLSPGNVVRLGAVMNGSNRDVVVEVQGNELVIGPGEVLFSSNCATGCSVTCIEGYLARCVVVDGCPQCRCPLESSAKTDTSGGKGSSNCGISVN